MVRNEIANLVLGELLVKHKSVVLNVFDYLSVRSGSSSYPEFSLIFGQGSLVGEIGENKLYVSHRLSEFTAWVGERPYSDREWEPDQTIKFPIV